MPRVSSKTTHVQKRGDTSASVRAESREALVAQDVIREHKLSCILCSETFNTTYHLTLHIEQNHPGQTTIRFQCGFEHCKQVFFSAAECDVHHGFHCQPEMRYCATYIPLAPIQGCRTATGAETQAPTLLLKCPFHKPATRSSCVTYHKQKSHATYGSFVCTGKRAKKAKQEGWLAQACANSQPKGRRRPKQEIRAPSEESTFSSHSASSSSSSSSSSSQISAASLASWNSASSSSSSTSFPSSPASLSSFFCSSSSSQSSQRSPAPSPSNAFFNASSPTTIDSSLPECVSSETTGAPQGYSESAVPSSSCAANETVPSYDWVPPIESPSPVSSPTMDQTSVPRVFGWSADSQSSSSSQFTPSPYLFVSVEHLLAYLDPLDPSDPYPSAAYVRKEPRM